MWAHNRQKRFLAPPYVKKILNFFFQFRGPFYTSEAIFHFFGTLKNLDTFPLRPPSIYAVVYDTEAQIRRGI